MIDEDYDEIDYLIDNDPIELGNRLRIANSILRTAFPDHYKLPDDLLDNWKILAINLSDKQIAYMRKYEAER